MVLIVVRLTLLLQNTTKYYLLPMFGFEKADSLFHFCPYIVKMLVLNNAHSLKKHLVLMGPVKQRRHLSSDESWQAFRLAPPFSYPTTTERHIKRYSGWLGKHVIGAKPPSLPPKKDPSPTSGGFASRLGAGGRSARVSYHRTGPAWFSGAWSCCYIILLLLPDAHSLGGIYVRQLSR